jgi:hypothetical protein
LEKRVPKYLFKGKNGNSGGDEKETEGGKRKIYLTQAKFQGLVPFIHIFPPFNFE